MKSMAANKMTEQLKELWENSDDIQVIWPRKGSDIYANEQILEKFAKLILKECLAICEDLGDKGLDGHYCADEIVKRFGK